MNTKTSIKKVFFKGLIKKNENRSLGNPIILMFLFFWAALSAQVTLPDANSCTSKDLELVGASLPAPNNDPCACGGTRTLMLTINNKTGSIRTSFALWGTLIIYNSDGSQKSRENIFACAGPIPASSLITMPSSKTISFGCGESLEIVDLFLAWTSANKKETCDVLEANPSVISPKCGTLPKIQVVAGVDADFNVTNATCLTAGSVQVSPYGGIGPYMAAVDAGTYQSVVGTSITFTNLSAGPHTFKIKDSRNCEATRSRTVLNPSSVTANAGTDFTISCSENTSGSKIGEAPEMGFSYSWSSNPLGFSSTEANPSVNPSITTTYTVVKTNNASGCFDDDSVTVTVNNTSVKANAGTDFTISCTANTSGGNIGEAPEIGFSYSWTSDPAGFTSTDANPSVNPSVTTTYTVVKTNISSGCYDDDSVTVKVDNAAVTAEAGTGFTKTCSAYTSGGTIGEGAVTGFSYLWTSVPSGFTSSEANPSVNPSVTTTYTVVKTYIASGCQDEDSVTVTVNDTLPDTPSVCIVQPTLCGPATGSITVNSPLGTQYEYSIDGGDNWQDSPDFKDLAAGSVTSIMVRNKITGCVSGGTDCSVSNCSAPESRVQDLEEYIEPDKEIKQETSVKAFPNPFKNTINFVVDVPESGEGSLDLMNMQGEKVKTVFIGKFNTGKNTYEVNLPSHQPTTLIYILRIGNKRITGKLIQM